MTDEMEILTPSDLSSMSSMTTTTATRNAADAPTVKRAIAEMLRKRGLTETYIPYLGKKIPYSEFLAIQLYDGLVEGKITFADGSHVDITTSKEWLELAKFVATHLDGPVNVNQVNAGEINIVKVYNGINIDDV